MTRSHAQERSDAATEEGTERSKERKDESKFCFRNYAVR